ncbi:HXXEE domain-containing protein [Rothia nasisuis]|uniref:HXXEE domain-containing protein n=1 Tax=Rothia nasisuis TaxID=2109647 RepID=UPI001F29955B|nr:HXXEE domain-containing protein [Rothia nasisuis]
MTAEALVYIVVVLFLVHEFEEMVMVAPWVRRQLRHGSARTRNHYFVHRFAGASQAVIVFMIGIEFLILSGIAILALLTGWYSLMIGFLLPYTLHLMGHITEWFVYRSYTPSLVTSIVTLPLCVAAGWGLYMVSGATPASVGTSAVVMTVLFAANFAIIGILEPRAKRWFHAYEQPTVEHPAAGQET